MNEITVSAKTVEDAIIDASIQLGISSDQIEYDVIEKGSVGFLGIGSKKAVIKVRKKSDITKPEPAEKQEPIQEPVKKDKLIEKPIESQTKSKPVSSAKKAASTEKKDSGEPRKETELALVTKEAIDVTEKFLKDVMKSMGMEVAVSSKIDSEGALAIELKSDSMGILIGKRGQTLDSLQYLANRVANKAQDGYVRVKLDTENYRDRRKATLENLARNIAYKVKRNKKSISLEPMNPYERRIIHSVLQSDHLVDTHSEGEEPYRCVVVTLAKRN